MCDPTGSLTVRHQTIHLDSQRIDGHDFVYDTPTCSDPILCYASFCVHFGSCSALCHSLSYTLFLFCVVIYPMLQHDYSLTSHPYANKNFSFKWPHYKLGSNEQPFLS